MKREQEFEMRKWLLKTNEIKSPVHKEFGMWPRADAGYTHPNTHAAHTPKPRPKP